MSPQLITSGSVREMRDEPAVLPFGAAYSLIMPTRQDHESLLRFLTGLDDGFPAFFKETAHAGWLHALMEGASGQVAVAAEDGALLSWLDSWSNLILPLYYESPKAADAAEHRVGAIFEALGERAENFHSRPVSALTLYERRLAGFVKSMLVEPQLLVLDSIFERLGKLEQLRVMNWIKLFRQRFPLRRVLYVGLAELNEPRLLSGFTSIQVAETAP